MKRLAAIVMIFMAVTLTAFAVGVAELKNVHLEDARRYVTDPFGVMSPAQVAEADAIIGRIWQQTSVELLTVVVDESEDDDPNTMSTEIFTDWGIGKKDKDNGVLLFIDNANRQVVIRTGYGVEGVLPDIICGRIIRNTIVPEIRRDGVGAGVIAGLSEIEKVLTNPEYAEELRSSIPNDQLQPGLQGDMDWSTSDTILILLMAGGVIAFFFYMSRKAQGPTKCPKCHTKLEPVDPLVTANYLNPVQLTEQRIGSRNYRALRCPNDGNVVVTYDPGRNSRLYQTCERCGAQAVATKELLTQGRPTGYYEQTCLHCGDTHRRRRRDDSGLAGAAILGGILGMMNGRGGGFGGGGFGGGSMGGGSTGGGGASGGW